MSEGAERRKERVGWIESSQAYRRLFAARLAKLVRRPTGGPLPPAAEPAAAAACCVREGCSEMEPAAAVVSRAEWEAGCFAKYAGAATAAASARVRKLHDQMRSSVGVGHFERQIPDYCMSL